MGMRWISLGKVSRAHICCGLPSFSGFTQEFDRTSRGSRKCPLETNPSEQFAISPYLFLGGSEVDAEDSLEANIRYPINEFTDDSPHLASAHRIMAHRCLALERDN